MATTVKNNYNKVIGNRCISTAFKRNLMRLRSDADMTQAEFGKKVGCTATEISHYETGKYLPNLRTATKIAAALGITLAELACERSDLKAITGRRKIHKMNLVDRIEYLQAKLKLTNAVFFKRAGISAGVINSMRANKATPCLGTLYDIADSLNCTAADLLYGIENVVIAEKVEEPVWTAKEKKIEEHTTVEEAKPIAEATAVETSEAVNAVPAIPELIRPFVENITLRRCVADMTRGELARKSGIDESCIAAYENGTSTPVLEQLYDLAAALGCTAADLLNEPVNSTFAKNLILARVTKNVFQKDLAAAVGVDVQTVKAYELSVKTPNVETLYKMAAVLGCSAASLV